MKKTILICITLLMLGMNNLFSQQRGMKIINKATGEELSVYDKSWALVVGINKYKEWTPLNYAVNDAKSVKDLLITQFGFDKDHVKYITDEQATLQNIKTTLSDIAAKAGENDRVLIFFQDMDKLFLCLLAAGKWDS